MDAPPMTVARLLEPQAKVGTMSEVYDTYLGADNATWRKLQLQWRAEMQSMFHRKGDRRLSVLEGESAAAAALQRLTCAVKTVGSGPGHRSGGTVPVASGQAPSRSATTPQRRVIRRSRSQSRSQSQSRSRSQSRPQSRSQSKSGTAHLHRERPGR